MATNTLIEVDGKFHIFNGQSATLCGLRPNESGRAIMRSTATDCENCQVEYQNFLSTIEVSARRFLSELIELYKKYGLSISHEDHHGAFYLTEYSDDNVEWIKNSWVKIFDEEVVGYGELNDG